MADISSMTAYGQARGEAQGVRLVVEIRSVNHRYLDLGVHIPKKFMGLEPGIKKTVAQAASRGRVEVFVNVDESALAAGKLNVNMELAKSYMNFFVLIKEELKISDNISLSDILSMKDIFITSEQEVDFDSLTHKFAPILKEALDKFLEMRKTEGQILSRDLAARLDQVEAWVASITARREVLIAENRARLEERITALVQDHELDEGRLAQEAAYLATRGDITEELIRLGSHLEQFRANLSAGGVIGRRLDFILQEINREINTISSKTGDLDVTNTVLDLKSELEKLREQVQNIE